MIERLVQEDGSNEGRFLRGWGEEVEGSQGKGKGLKKRGTSPVQKTSVRPPSGTDFWAPSKDACSSPSSLWCQAGRSLCQKDPEVVR